MALEIVYVADNNYVPYTGISILSLLENNKDFNQINIYFLDLGVNTKNKEKLFNIVNYYNRNISFINVDSSKINSEYVKNYKKLPYYMALFVTVFLPETVNRVIFLDSDSIILGSLKNLWNMKLDNNFAGAVLEPKLNHDTAGHAKRLLGLKETDYYFNTGVIYIDCVKWRNCHIEEKFIDYINKNKDNFIYPDQDVFNVVLNGKIKVLDLRYNFFPELSLLSYKNLMNWTVNKAYYSKQDFESAKKNPLFIHFQYGLTGRAWFKPNHMPFNKEFDKYFNLAPWNYEEVYVKDKRPINFKILYYLVYKFPFLFFSTFLKIIRKIMRWN